MVPPPARVPPGEAPRRNGCHPLHDEHQPLAALLGQPPRPAVRDTDGTGALITIPAHRREHDTDKRPEAPHAEGLHLGRHRRDAGVRTRFLLRQGKKGRKGAEAEAPQAQGCHTVRRVRRVPASRAVRGVQRRDPVLHGTRPPQVRGHQGLVARGPQGARLHRHALYDRGQPQGAGGHPYGGEKRSQGNRQGESACVV